MRDVGGFIGVFGECGGEFWTDVKDKRGDPKLEDGADFGRGKGEGVGDVDLEEGLVGVAAIADIYARAAVKSAEFDIGGVRGVGEEAPAFDHKGSTWEGVGFEGCCGGPPKYFKKGEGFGDIFLDREVVHESQRRSSKDGDDVENGFQW